MDFMLNTEMSNWSLPAGMSPAEFYQRIPLAIASTSAAAVLFWDHLVLMPHELKAYYSTEAPHWRPWDLPVFIFLRYCGIACMIGFLFLNVVATNNCQAIWYVVQATYVATMAASCYLLALRVSNMLWDNDRSVTIWLGLLSVGSVGCRAAVASQSSVKQVGTLPFTSVCLLQPFPTWIGIDHASVLIFNLFCLVFALGKLADQRRKGSFEILHYQRMLPYYGAAMAGNGAFLVIQLLSHEFDYVKASAAPFSVLISVSTASRVALNTRSLRQFRFNFEVKDVRQPSSSPNNGSRSFQSPQPDNLAKLSSFTSSPTVAPRKLSEGFSFSEIPPKRSSSSHRSRTPSPLPLAQMGVNMPRNNSIEIEVKDVLPDSPAALSARTPPDTAKSSTGATVSHHENTPPIASPIVFSLPSPGSNTPLTARTPVTASLRTPMTAVTPSSTFSELEFAPTSGIIGTKQLSLSQGGATLRTPLNGNVSANSSSTSLPAAGYRLLGAETRFGAGSSIPGSIKPSTLPQNAYTTFPSPPSSISSLTFNTPSSAPSHLIPPSLTSPFGNLAKLKKGKTTDNVLGSKDRSGWTE